MLVIACPFEKSYVLAERSPTAESMRRVEFEVKINLGKKGIFR